MSTAHILIVDDEKDIRELVKEILEDEGYEVSVAENGEAARRARQQRRPDLILLDIWMPDVDGITLLKEWSDGEHGPDTPVIMISGHGTVETAVEATRSGACDFLEKPLSLAKLLLTVQRALELDKLRQENIGLRKRARHLAEPLGKSLVMQHLREQVKRIALSDAWVLITGEPGCGKKLIARYLHANSSRSNGPFIEVNMGCMTPKNSALELFGHEDQGKIHYGRLEQASSGTLFLDQVADMDLEIQSRLVGALQSKFFLRVNGHEPVPLNARVIAATQRHLEQEIQHKRFRQDLYYQLNVVPLRVPPLREHIEDTPELLQFYVDELVETDGLPYRSFSFAAQNRLRNYVWPGNIRELKNLVQRLLILGTGPEIDLAEVEAALGQRSLPDEAIPDTHFDLPLREARELFEKSYFEFQLQRAGGNVSDVAKAAGIERTHLYRKLRALGISSKEEKS